MACCHPHSQALPIMPVPWATTIQATRPAYANLRLCMSAYRWRNKHHGLLSSLVHSILGRERLRTHVVMMTVAYHTGDKPGFEVRTKAHRNTLSCHVSLHHRTGHAWFHHLACDTPARLMFCSDRVCVLPHASSQVEAAQLVSLEELTACITRVCVLFCVFFRSRLLSLSH